MDPTQMTPDQINMLMNLLGQPGNQPGAPMSVPDQQASLGNYQQQGMGNGGMVSQATSPAMTGMPVPGGTPSPQMMQPGMGNAGITPAAYSAMFGVPATTNPSYGAAY